MITLDTFRQILGEKGKHLNDDEIEKLLQVQYKLANVFFDMWIDKTDPIIIKKETFIIHKKNGNCISVETYSSIKIYA